MQTQEQIDLMIESIKKDIGDLENDRSKDFDLRMKLSDEKARMISVLEWVKGEEDSIFISSNYNGD